LLFVSRKDYFPNVPDDVLPQRRMPAKGVHISLGGSNWVFLTVCTQGRARWLTQISIQRTLHDIWLHPATAWLVSDYLLMPDHLHLFCAPRAQVVMGRNALRRVRTALPQQRPTSDDQQVVPTEVHKFVSIERWIAFWKDQLAKRCPEAGKFQRGGFHHRLRAAESYSEKWRYVRENPIRAEWVAHPDDWPYQGRVHNIRFGCCR
jgi:putative transposase